MIEFIPLASGSTGNAYLVKSEGFAPLLIDAGLNYQALQRKLWMAGTSAQQLAGVLISHGHGDHCAAVPKLLRAGVDVWASSESWDAMSKESQHHRANLLQSGENPYVIGDWRVLPFNVPHDMNVLGFMIEDRTDDDRLVYATDCGYLPDRFEGVHVLAIEANFSEEIMRENAMSGAISTDRFKRTTASHMSIERLVECLRANDLSRCRAIYLLHLSAANSDAEKFRDTVRKTCGIPTYVCAERGGLMEFTAPSYPCA